MTHCHGSPNHHAIPSPGISSNDVLVVASSSFRQTRHDHSLGHRWLGSITEENRLSLCIPPIHVCPLQSLLSVWWRQNGSPLQQKPTLVNLRDIDLQLKNFPITVLRTVSEKRISPMVTNNDMIMDWICHSWPSASGSIRGRPCFKPVPRAIKGGEVNA